MANPVRFGLQKMRSFDREIRSQFMSDYEEAAAGKLNHWQASPLSCLAAIVLLDQFPRNLFRGTPQAFATDPPSPSSSTACCC